MSQLLRVSVLTGLLLVIFVYPVFAQTGDVNILFLTKSGGFEHSVISWERGKPSWAGRVMQKLAGENGASITCTKDASLINSEDLEQYDLVVFYTSGDLRNKGKDTGAPMGKDGVQALLDWIRNGGRFMGFHSATDCFHTPEGGKVTPFLEMIGAEFDGHGKQFKGSLEVVDRDHPTMAPIPQDWTVKEEWYSFKNFNKDAIHVLALLQIGDERKKQDKYDVPDYPMIWCRQYGKGRIYYNGMGHREDLWLNEVFQRSIVDAAEWLLDDGPPRAEPGRP